MTSSTRGRGGWLIAILTASFVLRIVVGFGLFDHPERALRPDSAGFSDIAENLARGNGYTGDLEPPRVPAVGRTPVYPLFLVAVQSLGRDVKWVWVIQVTLDVCTALLVYRIARRLLDHRFALIACACYGIGMSGAVYSAFVMSETLFTLLVTAFGYSTLRALGETGTFAVARTPTRTRARTRIQWLAMSATLLAAAILCRPIGVALLPLLCFSLFVGARVSWRRRAGDLLVVGVTLAALVGPWIYRNWKITGHATISTIGEYNFLAYNATAVLADESGRLESDVRRELEASIGSRPGDWTWIPRARSTALSIILPRMPRYIWVHARDSLLGIVPDVSGLLELQGVTRGSRGTMSILRQDGIIAATRHYFGGAWGGVALTLPWLVLMGVVWLAALVGALVGVASRDARIGFLCLWVGAHLFAAGPASHPRFGIPVFPAVAVLAGVGAAWFRATESGTLPRHGSDQLRDRAGAVPALETELRRGRRHARARRAGRPGTPAGLRPQAELV